MDGSVIKLEIQESLVTDEMICESAESDWTDSAPCNSGTNPEDATKLKCECLMDNPAKRGMNEKIQVVKMGNSFIEPSSTMISNLIVIAPQEDNFGEYEPLQTNGMSYSPDHQEDINQDIKISAVQQEMVAIGIKEEISEDVSEKEIDDQPVRGEIQNQEEDIKLEDDINCPWVDNLTETVEPEALSAVVKNKMSEDRLQELLIKSERMLEENTQPRSCAPDLPDLQGLLPGESGIIQTDTGVWSSKFLPKGTEFGPYDHSVVSSERLAEGFDWTSSLRKSTGDIKHNMVAKLVGSQIFYKLVTDIQPQTELILLELKPNNNIDDTETDSAIPCQELDTSVTTTQRHSTTKPHQCIECGKTFGRKHGLVSHMHKHTGEKPHQCKQCGKFFSWSGNLKRHMTSHTKEKPFQCTKCGNQFRQNRGLQEHILTHLGEKPHECIECGKKFTRKGGLLEHMVIHTGKKRHQCIECGKKFAQKYDLVRHMLTHSGDKPHKCKKCGKFFSRSTTLKRHMLTHSGEKPHECIQCGRFFSRSATLKRHMLTHSGEKPHQCKQCGKFFSESGNLKQHILTHSGDKPHECKQCGKFFSRSGNLKQHMLTHSGEKPHECKQCGEFFSLSGNLIRHMKSHQ